MGMKRNLQIVWDETTSPLGGTPDTNKTPRRFIARAFSDSGPGWGVWDRKRDRFLKNREIGPLSIEAVRQSWVQ